MRINITEKKVFRNYHIKLLPIDQVVSRKVYKEYFDYNCYHKQNKERMHCILTRKSNEQEVDGIEGFVPI